MSISRTSSFRMLLSSSIRLMLVVMVLPSACQSDRSPPKNNSKTDVIAFPKVVGGTDAPQGRFPYICSIRQRGFRKHTCGGTLIKPQWVLTAAHCVDPEHDGSTGMSPIVYCGIYQRDERNSSKVFAADRTTIHPEWKGDILDGFDVALIKLKQPYDVPLPDLDTAKNTYKSGSVFAALGWGFAPNGRMAGLLQVARSIRFVAIRICNQARYWSGQIKDSMICAGTGEQDTQQGDSGGPLLQLDYPDGDYTLGEPSYDLLVGITSFGGGSERGFVPSVYTSVGYFRDWIDCIVEEKQENCSSFAQRTTESVDESNSTSSTATKIEQGSKSSSTPKASSIDPKTSGDSSTMSPDTLPELSIEAPGSLVEGSEETAEGDGVPLDPCLEVKPWRNFSQTIELINARTAIYEDDSDTLEKLLCAGLSPKTEFSISSSAVNWTLLHVAAKYDAIKSARVLIGYGADIEEPDKYGNSSFHVAARYNSVRVVKLLIESGADVDSLSEDDWQPLHVAAFYDFKDIAKLLIDSGAYVDSRSSDGSTALHLAALGNALGAAKLLVDKEANIESKDRLNETPLHRAADKNAPEVAKFLIDAGANIDSKDDLGDTPLHDAAWWGSLEIVELLVYSGADPNVKGNEGQTPLHYAARANRFDVAKFLVNNGASKTERNNARYSPYYEICRDTRVACSSEDREKLRSLLRA